MELHQHICDFFFVLADAKVTSSGNMPSVKYVATPTARPVPKITINHHHKDKPVVPPGEKEKSSDTKDKQISNGEPPRKKTLREMLAGIPGFSMKVRTCCSKSSRTFKVFL